MAPRRTTLTFTSDDVAAPAHEGLVVLYCQASGLHALTTDVDLASAPRRRTDGATILDTNTAAAASKTVKLYARDADTVVVTRRGARREVVTRLVVGGEGGDAGVAASTSLPAVQVGYRSPARPGLIYLLPDALTDAPGTSATGDAPPPPPCITPLSGGGCAVTLALVGGAATPSVAAISAAAVTLALEPPDGAATLDEAAVDLAQKLLNVRRSQLALQPGPGGPATRLLLVTLVPPPEAFAKLVEARKGVVA